MQTELKSSVLDNCTVVVGEKDTAISGSMSYIRLFNGGVTAYIQGRDKLVKLRDFLDLLVDDTDAPS